MVGKRGQVTLLHLSTCYKSLSLDRQTLQGFPFSPNSEILPPKPSLVSKMFTDQVFDVPLGIRALEKIASACCVNFPFKWKLNLHRFNVLFLTFLSYSSYHLARKPTSVVKNVLHKNCSEEIPPDGFNITDDNRDNWCSWSPFDGPDHSTLLGAIDSSFLFAYAFGMYFTGSLGERMNIRIFLSVGMILSGIFGLLFGVAYWTSIHSLAYFIIIQLLAGLCQSTGWPGCVAAVGNWFGKSKRGFIMGIWRSHHSIGNILGSLIAAVFVSYDWGLSFAVPAAIIMGLGLLLFLFLVPDPRAVGCPMPEHHDTSSDSSVSGSDPEINMNTMAADAVETKKLEELENPKTDNEKPIGFMAALKIPGVIEFSLCLFFTKLINYTFLYWLPTYIKTSTEFDEKESADLSTLFDIGGIFGGIIAGLITDATGMSAIVCAVMLLLLFPMLFVYQAFGAISLTLNIILLFIVGLLANGPYALITTAVSADLGTHESLRNSARALATVTAIIDGTGSIGAAVGPLMAGPVSATNWENVFYVLMGAAALALLFLMRLVVKEVKLQCSKCKAAKKTDSPAQENEDKVEAS